MQWLTLALFLAAFAPSLQAAYNPIIPAQNQNLTAFLLARQKRHQLLYENGGSIRLIIATVMATQLADPVTWRSLVYFYVLHFGGFTLPSAPLYPWDKWETIFARSLQEKIKQLDATHEDDTRLFAYAALENYMDRCSATAGRGRQCLLRGICENAQIHHHVGILAELVNVLLTPGKTRLDEAYHEAYAAGLAGVDCLDKFSDCARGESVLDSLVVDVEN